jgi:hypothetical protein
MLNSFVILANFKLIPPSVVIFNSLKVLRIKWFVFAVPFQNFGIMDHTDVWWDSEGLAHLGVPT